MSAFDLHLPPLTGRTLVLARVVWVVVALATVALQVAGALTAGQWMTEAQPAFRAAGLQVGYSAARDGQALFPLSEAARRSGVRDNDVLVAVDGRPLGPDAGVREWSARVQGPEGTAVELTTRSLDGEIRRHRLIRTADPGRGDDRLLARDLLLSGVTGLCALASLAAAALLFFSRPRDPVAWLASLSFLFTGALGGFGGDLKLAGDHAAELVRGLAFVGLTLNLWVWCFFPDGRLAPRWTGLLVPAVPLAVAVYAFAWLSHAVGFVVLGAATAALAAGQIVRWRAHASRSQRQQTKWALLGVVVATALVVACAVLGLVPGPEEWRFWRGALVPLLATLALLALPLGLLLSLLRYRLWDVDAVISRSAGYAVLTLLLGAVWAGGEKAIEVLFEQLFGHEAGAASAGVAAGLAALMAMPAHQRVHHWAERRFQRGLFELRRALPTLVGDLRETEDAAGLFGTVLERLCAELHCDRAAAMIAGDAGPAVAAVRGVEPAVVAAWAAGAGAGAQAKTVEQARDDALFPLRVTLAADVGGARRVVGRLALGPRPDGSGYGTDEVATLAEVAGPIARAAWVARAREIRRDAQEARLRALEAALERATAAPGSARGRAGAV